MKGSEGITTYQGIPPKRENEDWKSYCFRQKAYITMLEGELEQYREMMEYAKKLERQCRSMREYFDRYVKVI